MAAGSSRRSVDNATFAVCSKLKVVTTLFKSEVTAPPGTPPSDPVLYRDSQTLCPDCGGAAGAALAGCTLAVMQEPPATCVKFSDLGVAIKSVVAHAFNPSIAGVWGQRQADRGQPGLQSEHRQLRVHSETVS